MLFVCIGFYLPISQKRIRLQQPQRGLRYSSVELTIGAVYDAILDSPLLHRADSFMALLTVLASVKLSNEPFAAGEPA